MPPPSGVGEAECFRLGIGTPNREGRIVAGQPVSRHEISEQPSASITRPGTLEIAYDERVSRDPAHLRQYIDSFAGIEMVERKRERCDIEGIRLVRQRLGIRLLDPEIARSFGGSRHGENLRLEIGGHDAEIQVRTPGTFQQGERDVRRTGGDIEQLALLEMPGQARHDMHNGRGTAEVPVGTSNIAQITGQVRAGDRR